MHVSEFDFSIDSNIVLIESVRQPASKACIIVEILEKSACPAAGVTRIRKESLGECIDSSGTFSM